MLWDFGDMAMKAPAPTLADFMAVFQLMKSQLPSV